VTRSRSTLLVLPAHNEQAVISEVVAQLVTRYEWPVVVVDDASSDQTATLAREAGATVLTLPIQLGAWGAMQAGMRHALRKGYSRVVTLDADGQHPPHEIGRLLEALGRDGVDVVVGSCTARGSRLRRVAWQLFRTIGGLPISDLTSGFRAYGSDAVELLASPDATLLEYQDVGVLLLLRESGLNVAEVAVSMLPRNTDRSGKSRIFYSWRAVIYYMIHTTILCMARGRRGRGRGKSIDGERSVGTGYPS
jgi:glycosyltransferase involved in cell wall biosynthesis